MIEERDELDQGAEAEEGDETPNDGSANEEAEGAALPTWRPGGANLGRVLRTQEVEAEYGEPTRVFSSERRGRGFAFRLRDGAFADRFVDAVSLGDILVRWGRATAWTNNALYGRRSVPGFEYAAAIASVVVQFTASPEENIAREAGHPLTPTAISGRWLAGLLNADEPEVLEASTVMRPRATGSLLKALEEVAALEAGIDWLLLDEDAPRGVSVAPSRVLDTIELLDQPVATRRRTLTLTGVLYAADQYGHTFKMEVIDGELAGRTIRGQYGAEASQTLEGAWRCAVEARILVTEAEKPGLPRSPPTRFELLRVDQIRRDVEVPSEPEQLRLADT